MRILFMGTPDFAVPSLAALYESGNEVVGVITQPDKPKGRGYALTPPPIKVYALEKGLPVYQPATLRDEAFASLLSELAPDLIAVVAYGKILPQNVLDHPKDGCINVHGSLLPKYRGAAPMQRAIMEGETVTGITIQHMAAGIDTGDIILTAPMAIEEEDNFESVHDKLSSLGADTLIKAIAAIKDGTAARIPQDHDAATHAAKVEKADCLLDFTRSAKELYDIIRGLSPIPLSFTHTPDGKLLKVAEATVAKKDGKMAEPGTVLSLEDGITVACGQGAITLCRVLPEGKGRMSAADFVRGRKVALGDILK